MRLICTIAPERSDENPFEFSFFLAGQGIENECEEFSAETAPNYRIWVYDEDLVEKAEKIYTDYQKNPKDPNFRAEFQKLTQAAEIEEEKVELTEVEAPKRRRGFLSAAPYGPISICILIGTIALFFWSQFARTEVIPPAIPGVIAAPVLAPVEKTLVFDYPPYFTMRDKLLTLYTAQDIEEQTPPSPEATALIGQMQKTPVWMGFYDLVVFFFQGKTAPLNYTGPLFGDVAKGEVWRLFTPALLHFDFLHIFFNILWFILLGNQIEYRLGTLRFGGLVLLLGVGSNVAQYLMSGPFFMGLSGIVCGMAAFIWARQQIAPWEGYLLNRFTLIFLGIFVIGMFVLSLIFFFMQIFGTFQLSVGIANTAHLTGGIIGYLFGRMRRIFAIKDGAAKE
ncbi:MAG: Rhomboid protease GlpG [Chlamydiales bacterium]|nr:Rhomboid protease GlpG [Chlamydiales bacterium]MCH9619920.1 Rhomboid protease GlpG [Chlamydiales bacterium]MCH9622653.1 Rhomboid protease GlpG [Chlamydiales bacterium]